MRVKDEARDKSLADRFRELARKRFLEEGRDPGDERALGLAIARERKNWIRSRLTDLGIAKSKDWGWPNIYTYTKSLGEQLVAAEEGIARAIVRPAIVESAIEFPFPGWNEGFTTTAPLVRMAMRGQNLFPVRTDVILDVIPVDMVASATLAVAALAMIEEPELVYQVASGDTNPSRLGRLVDLLGLYKRQHFLGKPSGSRFLNELAGRMEAQAVEPKSFEKYSMPLLNKATKKITKALGEVSARQVGPLAPLFEQAKEAVERFEAFTREGEEHYNTFRPFIVDNNYVFRTDNTRALFERIPDGLTFTTPRHRLVRLLAQRPPARPPEVGVPPVRRSRGRAAAPGLHVQESHRALRRVHQEPRGPDRDAHRAGQSMETSARSATPTAISVSVLSELPRF